MTPRTAEPQQEAEGAAMTQPTPKVRAVKRFDKVWDVEGLACKCGGPLVIDRCGTGEFLYETFCRTCKTCDPNGWRTIRQCLDNAAEYFGGSR